MRIAVGSDHAGFEGETPYKPAMIAHLAEQGHDVVDCGSFDAGAVDYPDIAKAVCEAIVDGVAECGVLLCGTGIGVCMAANKYKGIRAATCTTEEMVVLSRSHNDANVLCLGRRVLTLPQCLAFLDVWLATPFSGEARHARRIAKIS